QFLIIDGVRHKHRLVLGVHRANPKTDEQCQRKESRTCSRATSLPTNESRWFHASAFTRDAGLPYSIDFAEPVCQDPCMMRLRERACRNLGRNSALRCPDAAARRPYHASKLALLLCILAVAVRLFSINQ